MIFHTAKPRTLYHIVRDGLIEEAILRGGSVGLWSILPASTHGDRLRIMTMIRRMISTMATEFAGGIYIDGNTAFFTADFLTFCQTHRDMGSTEQQARDAWQAMR